MAKPNPLSAGLAAVVARAQPASMPPVAAPVAAPAPAASTKPAAKPQGRAQAAQEVVGASIAASAKSAARAGRVMIGGFFAPATHKQLRMLSVETDRTQQDLLAEALDLLFASHGKLQIAALGVERA